MGTKRRYQAVQGLCRSDFETFISDSACGYRVGWRVDPFVELLHSEFTENSLCWSFAAMT